MSGLDPNSSNENPKSKISPLPMLERIPRYLVPFHPKRVPHRFTDVLVIGGGLAGLRAALAVPDAISRCW